MSDSRKFAAQAYQVLVGFRERRLGRGDGFRRADMHPDAFEPQPEQPAVRASAIEQEREREGGGWRAGKQRRR
jgi:hypothetical protein